MKSEVERDLESELKSKLKDISRKMDITEITLSGASSNHNYKKMASKEPIPALIILNSLFSLWKRRREIEESLKQEKSKLAEMANASLHKIVRLNTCASDLVTRLQSESCRFQAKFKQTPGSRRYQMLSKSTNIMLLKDEVVPNVSK